MNFLFPGAFFLSAVALAIVALYLRRPRQKSLEVSTLLFWRRIFEREPHRRFLGRLRNPFSLLLQLLIFVVLLLALARPEEASPRGSRSMVIALDARARMQASDVFDKAVVAAQDLVSRLGPNDEVAILAAEGSPRIVSPFSSDGKDLRRRLALLTPSDAGGDMEETLLLARRLLDAKPGGQKLIIIGDRKTSVSGDAEQIAFGKPEENIGILGFSQRPLPASPQSAEVFLRLGNFSTTDRQAEIELSLDGRAFDLRQLPIAAGENLNFSAIVPKETLAGGNGFLVARLTSKDGLDFDNTAYAALPIRERIRVLLIGEEDPFLEWALKADPSLALEMLTPEMWRPEMGADFDAVVFDNWLPQDATLEKLGRGSFFFFGRTPFDVTGNEIRTASLELTGSESPLFWNVELEETPLAKAGKLAIPSGEQWRVSVPAESEGDPMVVALEGPRRERIVAAAFTVGSSNFPLRVGFPLFVSNVVHWLAGRRSEREDLWKAGQTFIPAKNEQISQEPIGRVEAKKVKTQPLSGGAPIRLTKNGFYQVSGLQQTRWLAVNTGDAAESDLRGAGTTNNISILVKSWGALQVWRWLALFAFLLIVLEWFLHHRRLTE